MTIFQFMKFVSEDAKVLNIIDATFSDYKGTSLKISNKYKLKTPTVLGEKYMFLNKS